LQAIVAPQIPVTFALVFPTTQEWIAVCW